MSQFDNLPAELREQLRKKSPSGAIREDLKGIFADGKQRTINDALIDYWKATKLVAKRGTMTAVLNELCGPHQDHYLRRCGKGVYVLNMGPENF